MVNDEFFKEMADQIGVDNELWIEWMQSRERLKCQNTPRALKSIIKKLIAYRDAGMNPTEIVERSLTHGWKTVYPNHTTSRSGTDFLSVEF